MVDLCDASPANPVDGLDDRTVVIEARDLRRSFPRRGGDPARAIDGISIQVHAGEFVVLVGPSGCGKTTLLRCLAGLESPTQGSVDLRGGRVFDHVQGRNVPTEKRGVGMFFQSYALWPHMTVFENVAYPLKVRKTARARTEARVNELLSMVGCETLSRQYPGELSGGQQQRVALARALAPGDDVVFFDEPLSNVDAQLREILRTEISVLQRKLGFAAVYVTHDQSEALALADRLVVLKEGRIAQEGSPRTVFARPNSAYAARFMGPVNEIPGTLLSDSGASTITTGLGRFDVAADAAHTDTKDALAIIRPTDIQLVEPASSAQGLTATVESVQFQGSHVDILVSVLGQELLVSDRSGRLISVGDDVEVLLPREHVIVVPDDGVRSSRLPAAETASVDGIARG